MSKQHKSMPKEMLIAPQLNVNLQTPSPTKCHALLINPFYAKDPYSSYGKHVLTPTLALSSIAGSTPDNWTLAYWDENLLQGHPPADPFPQVVGITVHLTFAERAYELAAWYRERGAIVIFGGLHVQSCTEECAPHADALALGEGTQLWEHILHDVENGSLQKRYDGSYKKPYREDPAPRRDLIPKEQFLTRGSMIATRGCHNRCNFCYLATEDMHMPYQMRTPQQVVQEILDEGSNYVVFVDNNLGSRPKYLEDLCDALMPLNIIWSAAVTIDVTDNEKILRKMALSGCTGVFVGFESLNSDSIVHTGKRTPMPDDYARRVQMLHDYGIQVNGSFVLGFDHDRPDVFNRTVNWIEANRLESATFHILTPYPATPLFADMEKEGRILHKDWSRYDTGHVVFQPKRMTAQQLREGYEYAYDRLFSWRSIWRRRPQQAAAVPAYLAGSLLYKKSNWLWRLLIKHRLTNALWKPLIALSRRRHVKYRESLLRQEDESLKFGIVPPGV